MQLFCLESESSDDDWIHHMIQSSKGRGEWVIQFQEHVDDKDKEKGLMIERPLIKLQLSWFLSTSSFFLSLCLCLYGKVLEIIFTLQWMTRAYKNTSCETSRLRRKEQTLSSFTFISWFPFFSFPLFLILFLHIVLSCQLSCVIVGHHELLALNCNGRQK